MNPDPTIAIPSIMKSHDSAWLAGFRARIVEDGELDHPKREIVAAIDSRLSELGEKTLRAQLRKPVGNLTLVERVQEAVRVYEQFLAHKHGGERRPAAARTRKMIKDYGEKGAVRRTVTKRNTPSGLKLLAKYDRLDCAYEQIILDFQDEFDASEIAKARKNLDRLHGAKKST